MILFHVCFHFCVSNANNFVVSLISDVSTHLTILLINKTIISCTNNQRAREKSSKRVNGPLKINKSTYTHKQTKNESMRLFKHGNLHKFYTEPLHCLVFPDTNQLSNKKSKLTIYFHSKWNQKLQLNSFWCATFMH